MDIKHAFFTPISVCADKDISLCGDLDSQNILNLGHSPHVDREGAVTPRAILPKVYNVLRTMNENIHLK